MNASLSPLAIVQHRTVGTIPILSDTENGTRFISTITKANKSFLLLKLIVHLATKIDRLNSTRANPKYGLKKCTQFFHKICISTYVLLTNMSLWNANSIWRQSTLKVFAPEAETTAKERKSEIKSISHINQPTYKTLQSAAILLPSLARQLKMLSWLEFGPKFMVLVPLRNKSQRVRFDGHQFWRHNSHLLLGSRDEDAGLIEHWGKIFPMKIKVSVLIIIVDRIFCGESVIWIGI